MGDSFIKASKALHKKNNNYGKASEYFKKGSMKYELTIPNAICCAAKVEPISSLLDHGCGKGGLIELVRQELPTLHKVCGFDPAIDIYSKRPSKKYDIVTSIDVLEHIGRGQIASTIREIKELTGKFFFSALTYWQHQKKLMDVMLIF